jgi:broad specificity phosphatase PhoE
MVKIVLIRHAEKLHESTLQYYDSPIRKSEWYRGETLLQNYIMKHDIQPTKIISSPYLRTRETATILSRITGLDIEVENGFSNYIGPRKSFNNEAFHESTLRYKPSRPETKSEFHKRIREALTSLIEESTEDETIWVVTHRFVISSCVTSINPKLRCTFKAMSGAIVEGGGITWLDG